MCKFKHPKVCKKYANYGKFSDKGCSSQSRCDKWHPKICYTGVNTGKCLRLDCPFYHGNGILRDVASQPTNLSKNGNNHRQVTDDKVAHSSDNRPNNNDSETQNQNIFLDMVQELRRDIDIWRKQIIESVQGYPSAQSSLYTNAPPPLNNMSGGSVMGHHSCISQLEDRPFLTNVPNHLPHFPELA